MRKLIAALAATLALAACGAPAYDEQAHRAEVEAVEGHIEDWPAIRDDMRAMCEAPEELFAFAVQANRAAGIPVDAHIRHLCPDRVAEAEALGGGS
jgi:hypothetical protein